MRNRLFFLIAALCLALSQGHSYAQKQIYGDVRDWLTNELLVGVKGVLMTTDSVVIDSVYTGWMGQIVTTRKPWFFKVKDESATYIIQFSYDNYQTQYKKINFNPRGRMKNYDFGTIKLKRQREQKLGVATVTASRVKFYTKKDTLVFNADAFQMAEGSMLDALIKQLPGVELKSNGEIYVNGKYVESLLLNGEDFFKKDNTVLLENLPSYTVNQVQVYKKQGDLSRFAGKNLGFDEEYVMDIKLKKQYSIGVLANAEGAAGTKDRYIDVFLPCASRRSRVCQRSPISTISTKHVSLEKAEIGLPRTPWMACRPQKPAEWTIWSATSVNVLRFLVMFH